MASLAPASKLFAQDADGRLGGRRQAGAVVLAHQIERRGLGVRDQAIAVHGDGVGGAQKPEAASLFSAGGNFGHGQRFENRFESVKEIERFEAGGMFIGADGHLLRAAAGGDEADARFHQAHIGFGRGMDARAMQADFAAAAQSQALRRDQHRLARVLEGQVGVLEAPDGVVNIVPLLLLRADKQQHEVGANGEVGRLVGHNHGVEIGVQALESGLDHGSDVVADGVHLGVKFAAKNAVAEIDEAGAGIARHLLGTILERFEKDDAGRLGNFYLRARGDDQRPESSPTEYS